MLLNLSKSILLLIFSMAMISSCEKAADMSEEEMEEEETFVGNEGKYPGGWTSTTEITSYTNYPVSGIFRYSNASQTKMAGEFFATGSFKSCCQLENDGTMTFEIENDSIKNFYFDDKVVDCEGIFRGEGVVENTGNIVINFTGTDCDGTHEGTLVFRKQ